MTRSIFLEKLLGVPKFYSEFHFTTQISHHKMTIKNLPRLSVNVISKVYFRIFHEILISLNYSHHNFTRPFFPDFGGFLFFFLKPRLMPLTYQKKVSHSIVFF